MKLIDKYLSWQSSLTPMELGIFIITGELMAGCIGFAIGMLFIRL